MHNLFKIGRFPLVYTILVAILPFITGCTKTSFVSFPAILGLAAGGAGGAAIAEAADGDALMAGIAGAGVGLLAGAAINEHYAEQNREKIVVRKADMTDFGEKREEYTSKKTVQDSTKHGKSETAPWDERYVGEDSEIPYQGPAMQYQNLDRLTP